MINHLFARTRAHAAALSLAAMTTLALLSALVTLADGYRIEAAPSQVAVQPQAQQVVVVGQRATRG